MKLYTPDLAGSGQFLKCGHCNLNPTEDGHDGCLGELPVDIVMNACCGHGREALNVIDALKNRGV